MKAFKITVNYKDGHGDTKANKSLAAKARRNFIKLQRGVVSQIKTQEGQRKAIKKLLKEAYSQAGLTKTKIKVSK